MLNIKLSGDAEKGWIGEVHDGDTHQVYHPEGGDLKSALSDMLDEHFADEKQKPEANKNAPSDAKAPAAPPPAQKPPVTAATTPAPAAKPSEPTKPA